MEEEMRRVAMLLGTVGLMALGLAATPAQARDAGWGYPASHQQAWRQHQSREWAWRRHEWRAHHYWHPGYDYQGYYAPRAYHAPGATLGFNLR
jgi:hypothetical protein